MIEDNKMKNEATLRETIGDENQEPEGRESKEETRGKLYPASTDCLNILLLSANLNSCTLSVSVSVELKLFIM